MDDDSSMTMVFSSWSTYKTSVLFSSWKCSTRLEFALTWFAVAFAAVAYHGVRYLVFMIEDYMYADSTPKVKPPVNNEQNPANKGYQYDGSGAVIGRETETERLHPTQDKGPDNEASRYLLLRLLHSIMAGVNYGIALLLMLIAMTFNPSLFLALVVGYTIGDFLFFARMRPQSPSDCH